jgi:hypothetical protein
VAKVKIEINRAAAARAGAATLYYRFDSRALARRRPRGFVVSSAAKVHVLFGGGLWTHSKAQPVVEGSFVFRPGQGPPK